MVDNEQLKDVIGRIKYERKLSQEEVAELFGTYKKKYVPIWYILKWSDLTTLKERDFVDNPIFVDYRKGF
jgi:hypothetical protein